MPGLVVTQAFLILYCLCSICNNVLPLLVDEYKPFIYLFSRKTCKILQLKPIHYTYSYSDILTTKKKQTKMYNNFNYLKL